MNKILFRYIAAVLLCMGYVQVVQAQTVYMWPGESREFVISAYSTSSQWSSSSPYVRCISANAAGGYATFKVDKYFTGYARIGATYQWFDYVNGRQVIRSGSQSWIVMCYQTSITVTESSIELYPDDTHQLSYYLGSHSYDDPVVTWNSADPTIAEVSANGLVTAHHPGTVAITANTDCNTSSTCTVTVTAYPPTSISLPATASTYIEQSIRLTPTFNSAQAWAPTTWASDNERVATVDPNGNVTGVGSGTALITATTDNGLSASTRVTVSEPPLVLTGVSPTEGATDVSLFVQPSMTFDNTISAGPSFAAITLEGNSGAVSGAAEISGTSVVFKPSKALQPYVSYTLRLPAGALNNKWGSPTTESYTLSFQTGPQNPMTLTCSIESGFVLKGTQVELHASEADAEIHYTLNGADPTESSPLYEGPLTVEQDMQLKARAFKDGYETPFIERSLRVSNMDIRVRFPNNEAMLYNYAGITPYVEYSSELQSASYVYGVEMKRNAVDWVSVQCYASGKRLYIVPYEPLQNGCTYSIKVSANAVYNKNGEPCTEMEWTFTTGDYALGVSAGYEVASAVRTDGSLWVWGKLVKTDVPATGYYTYDVWNEPTVLVPEGVRQASQGLMHGVFSKTDGSVWTWGRQYCGELGDQSGTMHFAPVQVTSGQTVVAGAQTTAVIDNGTLRLFGRNDHGQQGNYGFDIVTDANNMVQWSVRQVVTAYENTFYVSESNDLYGWGRNDQGQLLGASESVHQLSSVLMASDVAYVAASRWGNFSAALVKTDGTLYVWNAESDGLQPVMGDVRTVAVGADFMAAVKTDGTLWTWGENAYGQLGDGTLTASAAPKRIMDDVAAVDLGPHYAVVLKTDGSVWTWGRNRNGLLGTGDGSDRQSTPQQVMAGRSKTALESLLIDVKEINLDINASAPVSAKPQPLNADYTQWQWSSSDEAVATVDERGVVTGHDHGEARITLTSDDGITTSVMVYVGDSRVLLRGDVNYDNETDVRDIVDVVQYIQQQISRINVRAADINEDGSVNVADVVGIASVVLGTAEPVADARAATSELVADVMTLQPAGPAALVVTLDNSRAYTAFQLDLTLPDGIRLDAATIDGQRRNGHVLSVSPLADGHYRLVGYSLTNQPLAGTGGSLLRLELSAPLSGDLALTDILFVTPQGVSCLFDSMNWNTTTGIRPAVTSQRFDVYRLNGQLVVRGATTLHGLPAGLYIVNGKKIVVK